MRSVCPIHSRPGGQNLARGGPPSRPADKRSEDPTNRRRTNTIGRPCIGNRYGESFLFIPCPGRWRAIHTRLSKCSCSVFGCCGRRRQSGGIEEEGRANFFPSSVWLRFRRRRCLRGGGSWWWRAFVCSPPCLSLGPMMMLIIERVGRSGALPFEYVVRRAQWDIARK